MEQKIENTNIETPKKESNAQNSQKNSNSTAIALSTVALVISCIGALLAGISYQRYTTPITFLNNGTDGNSANFVEGSIADVANKVAKSVVAIETEIQTNTSFFGRNYSSTSAAAGTGIIVSEDGYILTNQHVIDGATKINVILADGTTYENVKLVTIDPLNDVAFLKINNVSDLPKATLGDSKTITVAQQVIAVGNALGQYQNTVTSGIISGTGRTITASDSTGYKTETLTDMIQTDAAINSGNSGGPLVNAAGEVIGINTAVSSEGENVGFAIPISSVKGMLSSLLETGSASRAYVGVYSTNITADVAKNYNLPVTSGAYIYSSSIYSSVMQGSPADKAGIKDKDIVVSINGVKIGSAGSISTITGEYKPGDTVQFVVLRSGQEIAINVTLGAYPEEQ